MTTKTLFVPFVAEEKICFTKPLDTLLPKTEYTVKNIITYYSKAEDKYLIDCVLHTKEGAESKVTISEKDFDNINSETKVRHFFNYEIKEISNKNPTMFYKGKRYSVVRIFPAEIMLIHEAQEDKYFEYLIENVKEKLNINNEEITNLMKEILK